MPVGSVAGLVDALQKSRILEPARLNELLRSLQGRFADPRALAKELMQRNWLTPYQANQLLQGRGEELLLGSYVLQERLGEGGMGLVFKAFHQKMGRVVALKLIRKDRLQRPEAIHRFEREIRAVAQLAHPNIVTAYDADQVGDTHFLVMEYVDGIDLAKLVKQCGPLPIEQAVAYIRQAALGLQHAFERGMIHRDIKPSNLLVSLKVGVVKILDMGLARMLETTTGETTNPLTETDAVIGTPDFGAPEQARQSHTVDIRGDLYSLGCTLYYLLTGQAPFPSGTVGEKLVKHQLDEPEPVEKLRPQVPPGLATILRKLMAKRPEDRYQTPAELSAVLEGGLKTGKWPASTTRTNFIRTSDPKTEVVAALAPLPLPASDEKPGFSVHKAIHRVRLLVEGYRDRNPLGWQKLKMGLGLGLVVLVIYLLWWRSGRSGSSPLDQLDANLVISEDRVLAGQPEGLVAVIGDQRMRHWGRARSVAYSQDGRLVASSGDDYTIRIWEAATGKQLRLLRHPSDVGAIWFVLGSQRVAVADYRGELHQWDTASGKEHPVLQGRILGLSADGSLAATVQGGQSSLVKTWKVATGLEQATVAGHTKGVYCFAFSPDGQLTASSGEEQTILLNDLTTGQMRNSLRGHNSNVNGLRFVAGGKLLVSADAEGFVKLWDVVNAKELITYPKQAAAWNIAPDGKTVALRNGNGPLKLWDALTFKERATFNHEVGVGIVSFSPDSQVVATGTAVYADTLKLWHGGTGEPKTLQGYAGPIAAFAFSPDSRSLASASSDGYIKVWDIAAGKERLPASNRTDWYTGAIFSPDGKTLALATRYNVVKLWDIATGKERAALEGHQRRLTALLATSDSKTLATASEDGTVKLWDIATGQLLSTLKHGRYAVTSIGFTEDGKTIASCEWYSAKLWDVATGQHLATFDASKSGAASAAVTPDAKLLALGNNDGVIQLWDLKTRQIIQTLQGLKGNVLVAFTPDGKMLLGRGGNDGVTKAWDLGVSKERATLPASHLWSLAPDNRSVAIASGEQGQLRVWDLATGQMKVSLEGHSKRVEAVVYSPDSQLIASVGQDGRVIVWDPTSRRRKVGEWQLPGFLQGIAFAPDGRHLATVNGNGSAYILRFNPVLESR